MNTRQSTGVKTYIKRIATCVYFFSSSDHLHIHTHIRYALCIHTMHYSGYVAPITTTTHNTTSIITSLAKKAGFCACCGVDVTRFRYILRSIYKHPAEMSTYVNA